jgi:tetratricopeptide (TPR) repeat protein
MYTRTSLGDALHQANEFDKSEAAFQEAEVRQAARQPDCPLLYSGYGFLYCDLLFDCDKPEAVNCRVKKTIEWAKQRRHRRWIALDELSLGRLAFIRARTEGTCDFTIAKKHFDSAVPEILAYGQEQEKPHALFARALLRFVAEDVDGCRADLDEAWQIAERGSMRLFMADVLLHRARLFRDKAALGEARKLIEECGYHRRDGELADAEEAAKGW